MLQNVRNRMWIGNEWVDANDGGTFETVNPATGERIADVASAQAADVDKAVASARAAMVDKGWRGMNPHKRSKLLWKLADAIEANADELGALETADNGKPYFEARKVDLPSVVENFRYFAGLADKI
ncbi:MAG: aldehyde dehydrogenase family protein, partial [Gemmatimonadota bacterium]|nr:aldehyde dehydrogenase family protein [Gemmatimonadota bacterium]